MTTKSNNSEGSAEQNGSDKYVVHMKEQELVKAILAALYQHEAILKPLPQETTPAIKLYSRSAVAEIFSVDVQTVTDWSTYGVLSKPLNFGKRKYYTHNQLLEAIEKRQNQQKNK